MLLRPQCILEKMNLQSPTFVSGTNALDIQLCEKKTVNKFDLDSMLNLVSS